MTRSWWQGTRLVAARSIAENLRSKTLRIATAILLMISIALVVLPSLAGEEETSFTLATVGEAPPALVAAVDAAAGALEFEVDYVALPDEAALRQAVADGDADAGLVGDTLFVASEADATVPALVSQAVVSLEVLLLLDQAGLTPEQVAELQSVQPPEQVFVGGAEADDRTGVAVVLGIVLYLAVTFAGSAIATAVALEKSTHISEVLLAVLRASQVMVGTVLAVGLLAVGQLLVFTAPVAIAAGLTDSIGLPPAAAGDIALSVAWFFLGFVLYSFVFAAAGALVNKVSEVSATTMPIQIVLLVGYLIGIMGAAEDSDGPISVVASFVPFTAPMVMPIRWAGGGVPVWQLVVAMLLTAATAAQLASIAGTAYRRALLITDRRPRLREVVGLR